MEHSHDLVILAFDLQIILIALLKLFLFDRFIHKGAHLAHAEQAVFHLRVQFADAPAGFPEGCLHFAVEMKENNHHDRNQCESNQGQERVDGAKNDARPYDFHRGNEILFRTVMGKLGNIKQVTGNARHQCADLGIVVKRKAQLLQMCKKIAPHIGFDFATHHMSDICHIVVSDRVNQTHDQIGYAAGNDQTHGQGFGAPLRFAGYLTHQHRQKQF